MSDIDIKKILVREEDYAEKMKEEVLPYIDERKTELMLSRNEGEELYCLKYAPENARAAVVISHGFTETIAKYSELAYYFLKEGIAVYLYDHCGHGKSYRLTDDADSVHVDTYERYVNDLNFIAEAAKKDYPDLPLYLFGHSMGGGIAAVSACHEPDLFSKVVLSSPMIRPATGSFPWFVTRIVCWLFVRIGKKFNYAPGQRPYDGKEHFEESASTSQARYDYYNEIRKSDRKCQMNAATYGWLYACVRLSTYLRKKGWKKMTAPVLLFQADNETFVINPQQDAFIEKLKKRGVSARLIHVPKTKHEIWRADDDTLEGYLDEIFRFYAA